MSRCVIIGAAPVEDYNCAPEIYDSDYVICADGGLEHALALGIEPQLVLGDFDSLPNREILQRYEHLVLPVEKDDTDTMAAVKRGLELGYRQFLIYGGTGGRFDHTMANLCALLYICEHGGAGVLTDGKVFMHVIQPGIFRLAGKKGWRLSLFPFGCASCVVSETGVHYPLDHDVLHASFPLGVSNDVLADNAFVSLHEGVLLILLEKI